LKDLLRQASGRTDCDTFRETTKSNHPFAVEYCARLLLFTVRHHGPIRDEHINQWLRQDAVLEFEKFLSE
jgi:hypothetical protein